jgi:predicted phosphoribosyltransferase
MYRRRYGMYFRDRTDAGRRLSRLLEKFRNQNAIVYALPRGGIVPGVEVARRLKLPMDLVVARKIGHPMNLEYAVGAVTENGHTAINRREIDVLDTTWFHAEMERQRKEAQRRRELYMRGRSSYPPKDQIAILVDDGIATGLTMKAAILDVRNQMPTSIVVAIPVIPAETAKELARMVDELIAVDIPQFYLGGVGAYYGYFPQVTDQEVIDLLDLVNPRNLNIQPV